MRPDDTEGFGPVGTNGPAPKPITVAEVQRIATTSKLRWTNAQGAVPADRLRELHGAYLHDQRILATAQALEDAERSADKFSQQAEDARNEAWRVTRERDDALTRLAEAERRLAASDAEVARMMEALWPFPGSRDNTKRDERGEWCVIDERGKHADGDEAWCADANRFEQATGLSVEQYAAERQGREG
jgi:hypothetical protein